MVSCSPTRIRTGTEIAEREGVVSVLAASARREPAMLKGEVWAMISRMNVTAVGFPSTVDGANTALTKSDAKAAAPFFLTAAICPARLIFPSSESGSLLVSQSTAPRNLPGSRSSARRVMYPPMESPAMTARPIFRWSSMPKRSSTCPSMLNCPSPTSLEPWPRMSYAIARCFAAATALHCPSHMAWLNGKP